MDTKDIVLKDTKEIMDGLIASLTGCEPFPFPVVKQHTPEAKVIIALMENDISSLKVVYEKLIYEHRSNEEYVIKLRKDFQIQCDKLMEPYRNELNKINEYEWVVKIPKPIDKIYVDISANP